MKKYIILVEAIDGLSGSPRYVNNKCRLLKEQGWEVMVFWNDDIFKVQLEHLIPFDDKEFIFHELNYYPAWFTRRKRTAVINQIAKRIGTADQIVIESNKLQLGAWGEMLAKQLNAKHIIFVTTEHIKIHRKNTFDYCYAKLKRNEFFTINQAAVQYLFSGFLTIQHPENYYWSASPGVEVKEYAFADFDRLPKADFTICHFGRAKGYFPYMLKELGSFILQHHDKSFNVFFLGDIDSITEIRNSLSLPNVNLAFHPAVEVVPLQVFTQSDVIIATAGCAKLAARYGGKVVAMDVNNQYPLGLLRYTTLDSNTNSGKYENHKSLSEWLQSLLIDKKVYREMETQNTPHQFAFQMQYVTNPDGHYFDTSHVNEGITKNDKLWITLCRIGLFPLVDRMYFFKRKKRLIQ